MADYLKVVYDEDVRPYTDYPSKLIKYLFDRYNMQPGMSILEPGCGRGEFLRNFSKLGMKATGLDLSEEPIELLAKDNIELFVCDVESDAGLPFDNDTFDASTI